jgi:hypothetical protein
MTIVTTQSHFEDLGLTISLFTPKILGKKFVTAFPADNSYSHEISAWEGYVACNFTVEKDIPIAESILERGLGYHVEVTNQAGSVRFAGFVNKLSLNCGGITVERGPIVEIANQVLVNYTPVDYSVFPEVVMSETVTTLAVNAESQAKYGIIEKWVGGGRIPTTNAEQIRDVFLQENKDPKQSVNIAISEGGEKAVLSFEVAGYYTWLDLNPYLNAGVAGFITASTRITNILTAEPNNLFSTDYTNIIANALLISDLAEGNKTGLAYIKEVLDQGDATDDRRLFMVLENEIVYYRTIPTAIEYYYSIGSNLQAVKSPGQALIYPWDVMPGKFIEVSDFMVGSLPIVDLRKNPKVAFIESVRFSAPWSLDLSGGKLDKLNQAIAKITYTGGLM